MSDWGLPWAGACRCGQTRVEITAAPLMASACHCSGCQKMTASAFALTLTLPEDGLKIMAGEPVIGGLHGATRHFFCPDCLSWMFTRPAEGGYVNLRPSVLGDRDWFMPYVEVYTATRMPGVETGALHSFSSHPSASDYVELAREFARRGARPSS